MIMIEIQNHHILSYHYHWDVNNLDERLMQQWLPTECVKCLKKHINLIKIS